MKRAAVLLLILSLVDWALTADGILLGLCEERNPAMGAAFDAGLHFALVVKAGAVIAGTVLLLVLRAERALWLATWLTAAVVLYQVAARIVLF